MATEPANPLATGDTLELYRAAIGPRGQDYYLRQFTRFDAAGKTGASWHWPAYWTTLNWLIFRKMWGQALAYVAAVLGMALLVFGVGKLLLNYDTTTSLALFLVFLTTAFVVPGLYANAWYYNYCNEKISAALRSTQDVKQACELLATQASSKRRFFGQAAVNVALMALLGGLAVVLLDPAQQMMQLAQGGSESPKPLMPEMAAGTQPVLAPTDGAPLQTQSAPAATPAPAVAEAPKTEAPATESAKAEEAPKAESAKADRVASESAAATPSEALPKLTSAAQIDEYLARTTGVPREPAIDNPPPVVAQAAVEPAAAAAPSKASSKTKPAAKVALAAAAVAPAKRAPSTSAAAPADPETLPAAAAGNDKPKTAKPTAVAAEGAASAPAPADKPKRGKAKKSWYVQAGAFSQEGNAQSVRLKIEAAGMQTSAAPSETKAGRLIRVRVGPFENKADAEKAALQIKALDLPAVLFKE